MLGGKILFYEMYLYNLTQYYKLSNVYTSKLNFEQVLQSFSYKNEQQSLIILYNDKVPVLSYKKKLKIKN